MTGVTLTEEDRKRFVRRNTALLSGAHASIWITVGVFVAAGPIAIVQLSLDERAWAACCLRYGRWRWEPGRNQEGC